jgi:hypothetical protein
MTATTLLPSSKLSTDDTAKLDFCFRINDLIFGLIRKYPLVPQEKWSEARDFLLKQDDWQNFAEQDDENLEIDLENLGLKHD